ncbi:DNA ligase I, ATP-dependent (dnl1) [Vittaforma corneae ATCC 50505]|uniref:DNA ligase n=1 Tax=Vittaforma corneae (strain ATCC 50505) TaxID=993615 RepID=L2GL75_VITCO|nr:DNA ligase I, ATP-dependent (dnl1) [Vittaforma corneae ATCC 50505]ELA41618.1 DNA ligase I, ATP-dependent (dnl1) [Vittaforma corneae ATCC 50505]
MAEKVAKKTLFIDLCKEFEKISNTTKRLEIQDILSSFFKKVISEDSQSLSSVLYLCHASIYPDYHNTELGIGEHMIQMVVAEGTGLTVKTIKQRYIKTGDLGEIAMESRVNQLFISKRQLTVVEVVDQLRRISRETGRNSMNSKKNIMLSLISASSPLEAKYMIRLFECQLKIGLALQTVLISLSLAFGEHEHDAIKEAYNKHPDFEHLSKMLLEHGVERLHEMCSIVPGIPVKPMLAQPSKNLTTAFAKVENEEFLSEFKYDGERVQIHHFDGKTKVFSRNSEDLTEKYPDISSLKINEKSFVLDGEAVAYEDGAILPFQTLSTRKRKNIDKIEVNVCVFVFDLLFYDSQELVHYPFKTRRDILKSNFKEIDDKLQMANGVECTSIEDVDSHFKVALQANCEGVMLKLLQSIYKPSHRSNKWVKLKKDYLDNLGDSLDLVVIGAFYGKGKRTGNFGGFLLAVYNDETDKFEACCKIGTGFNDEALQLYYDQLSPLITANLSRVVYNERSVKPDVWIEPKYVWEVKAASLSHSPIYSAGSSEKGISLRFPRFIKERPDKKPEDATTSNQIVRMYNENKNAEESEDDFN